jgi:hypothetical protein
VKPLRLHVVQSRSRPDQLSIRVKTEDRTASPFYEALTASGAEIGDVLELRPFNQLREAAVAELLRDMAGHECDATAQWINEDERGICPAPCGRCTSCRARAFLAPPPAGPSVGPIVQVGVGHGCWETVKEPLLHRDGSVSFIGTAGRRYRSKPGNWRSNGNPPAVTGDEIVYGVFDPEKQA